MGRASEELLAMIHGEVAAGIKDLIRSDDPREKTKGIEMALRFLKDNGITARMEASPETKALADMAHNTAREDLEKLMKLTPDD